MAKKQEAADLTAVAAAIRADLKVRYPTYRFSVIGSKTDQSITIALMEHSMAELTNEQLMAEWFAKAPDSLLFFDYTVWDIRRKRDVEADVFIKKIAIQCKNTSAFSDVDHTSAWLTPDAFCLFSSIQKQAKKIAGVRIKVRTSIGRVSRSRIIPAQFVQRTQQGRYRL